MIVRRSNLYSPRLRKKKRKVLYLKVGLGFFVFLLVVIGSYFLLRIPSLRITDIAVTGGESVVNTETVEAIAREKLVGSFWSFVPANNSFLYPGNAIRSSILETFPRVKEVRIRSVGLQTLSIELVLRKPLALWCGSTFDVNRTTPCYSFDDTGMIFESALMPGTTTIRYYGVIAATSTTLFGSIVAPTDDLQKLALFFIALSGENYHVTDVVLKNGGEADLYIKEGGHIIIDRTRDLSITLNNLNLLLSNASFAGGKTNAMQQVQYIDLRTSGKIFYKIK